MKNVYYLVKDGYYYRPESKGYTDNIDQAGLFSEDIANQVIKSTHGDIKKIKYIASILEVRFDKVGILIDSNITAYTSLNSLRFSDGVLSGQVEILKDTPKALFCWMEYYEEFRIYRER